MVFRILYLVGLVTCVLRPPIDPELQIDPLRENLELCNKFGKDPYFEQELVIGKPWRIYYTWNMKLGQKCLDMTFKNVSSWLVDRFRVELQKDLRDVNWNDSALFMESGIDFSALFLKTNVTGLYRIIPTLAFGMPNCPYMIFAIKVVDPGYLGVENCKQRYAYALAPVERFPKDDKLVEAASKLKFWNSLGRSYLAAPPPRPAFSRFEDEEIHDDEMELDPDWRVDDN